MLGLSGRSLVGATLHHSGSTLTTAVVGTMILPPLREKALGTTQCPAALPQAPRRCRLAPIG